MCGINGFATQGDTGGADALGTLSAMNDALVHRGPDEGGTLVHGRVALGARRLSIVDVAGGHQPMRTRDGRFALAYNGELYDFQRMRNDLQSRGVAFDTHCDTEVILASYATDGMACLTRFNGMFAFAISDESDGSVLLVRDQIGIKPLYYYHAPDGSLVFSSELGSLVTHPAVPRRLDHESLSMLLVDRTVADPFTMYRNVRQLPPGHWLRWRDGRIEIKSYYELEPKPGPRDEGEALEELRTRLDETVCSHLVADVPVAAFLSGGIDSSTVVAFAGRHLGRELHTFSVGFDEKGYDESAVARSVAEHVGTQHHALRVGNSSFRADVLDRIVRHVGEPHGDVSCVPTLMVSDFASERVKVVLSGDGGDELFGGYSHIFWAGRIRRTAAQWPAAMRQTALGTLQLASAVTPRRFAGPVRRARKGMALTFREPSEMMRRLMALWQPEELPGLLVERPGDLRPAWARPFVASESVRPEEFAMDYLLKTTMVDYILRKVDRMSMAASLEVRVPLLDRRIVEFALTLPLGLKIRGRTGKYLLRESARPLLPSAVFNHPKQGFLPPLHEWFNDEFWDVARTICAPGSDVAQLFRGPALEQVFHEARHAYAQQLRVSYDAVAARAWLIVQLGRWIDMFAVAL